MSDIIVKKERFWTLDTEVSLLTVESNILPYSRYFSIVKNGDVIYTSPAFFGGFPVDVDRNCDSALQVVRQLLTDTQFLRGEVVGS